MKTILVIFLSMLCLPLLAQQRIPIEISKNGHLMVRAVIHGVEGNFIFDTGAGLHVVSGRFFEKIRSHTRDSSFFSAFRHTGERLDGPIYQLGHIEVGGMIREEQPWIGVYPGFDDMGFDGLISCKLVEDKIVTVNPQKRELVLETTGSLAKKQKTGIPVLIHADRDRTLDFFIKIKVNQEFDALVEFDTGAGYAPLYLHSRYMAYTGTDTTTLERRMRSTGFGAEEKQFFDKNKKVKISVPGTSEGGHPNIVYKPSLIYDGLTSYIVFGDKPWTLDLGNRMLYLIH